jgi:hypothetical protein
MLVCSCVARCIVINGNLMGGHALFFVPPSKIGIGGLSKGCHNNWVRGLCFGFEAGGAKFCVGETLKP